MTSIGALLISVLGLILLLAYFTLIGVLVVSFVRAGIEAIGEFKQAPTFGARVDYGSQIVVGFGCTAGILICISCGLIAVLF